MFLKARAGRRYVRLREILPPSSTGHRLAGAICLAIGAAGVAAAQTSADGALDMADAVRAAVATHPRVRGASEQAQQADADVDVARAGYLPQITGGIENEINTYRNSSYDSRNVYTARLRGSLMLYDFGKVAGVVDQARSGVRATEAQVELATDDIAMNTALAWVDAHLQQALVQIAREQLDAVMSITALVTERAGKGATTRADVVQANARVEAVRSQFLGAEAEALRASLALMHLTGRTAPVAITGDIPRELMDDACRGGAQDDTPAVRLASAQRDGARAELDIAKADRLPTVSLDGSIGYALTDGSRLYGDYRTTGQVGIHISMPLYQGGSTLARQRGAVHQLRFYEDAVQQARLEMLQGFADAKAQADGWARRAPVLQTRVDSINATRKLYRQQYLQLGTRSLLDLLNAEQEYHSARVDQMQGLHQQYRLAVQCLYFSDRLRDAFELDQPHPSAAAALPYGPQP